MGKINIKAVAKSYSGDKDISTWKDFVNVIADNQATAQKEAYDFGETFRGRELKDCVGTKYSFGITNVSACLASQADCGLSVPFNGQLLGIHLSSLAYGIGHTKAVVHSQRDLIACIVHTACSNRFSVLDNSV